MHKRILLIYYAAHRVVTFLWQIIFVLFSVSLKDHGKGFQTHAVRASNSSWARRYKSPKWVEFRKMPQIMLVSLDSSWHPHRCIIDRLGQLFKSDDFGSFCPVIKRLLMMPDQFISEPLWYKSMIKNWCGVVRSHFDTGQNDQTPLA